MSPSSGYTRAGRAKAAAVLGLLLALASLHTEAASAATPPDLSLGFSPSSLSPVSQGSPVYTAGETIWAESGYSSSVTVSLSSPGGAAAVGARSLPPGTVVPLYTFAPTDQDGLWNITVITPLGASVASVRFVNLADHPVTLSPFLYSLDGGNLSISSTADLGDSYDQEVCAVGDQPSSGLSLLLPRDMDDRGNVTITPGSTFEVSAAGQVNESFSFWFELYHPYSLDVTSANSLVVDNLLAAESQPLDFSSAGSANTTLSWSTPFREGRYDFRAFFQNSTGLDVVQTTVLILNASSWVPLSECLPEAVQSPDLSYSASLAGGAATWPRTFYVMYRTFGVEAVAAYPVQANISSFAFRAYPWDEAITGAEVAVTPGPGVVQTSQAGGSVYVLASNYPATVNYSLEVGGQSIAKGSVAEDRSYQSTVDDVTLARLTVDVVGGQTPPTTLSVTGPGGLNVTAGAGLNQTASFFLPTGSYTVTGDQAGNSQSAQVGLTAGGSETVSLNMNAAQGLEVILVVTAVVAVLANLIVWTLRTRTLGSRMARDRPA